MFGFDGMFGFNVKSKRLWRPMLGVLVAYAVRSVVDAVRCAIEVQNGMVERNAGLPLEPASCSG
jgi:hypothetical protein